MVSVIEDARNVEHDVAAVGVEVIILVDDSVTFISSLLPILYGKLMKQSQRLISEGITLAHKVLRMRARPKVLLARSYEEAVALYEKYRRNVLGIISDVRFLRDVSLLFSWRFRRLFGSCQRVARQHGTHSCTYGVNPHPPRSRVGT